MSTTELDTSTTSTSSALFRGRRWRRIRESFTAYLFLLPAFLIIGTFGLFPMAFSIYISLHRWRIIRGDFLGLDHYTRALDNLAYVAAFWICVILIYLVVRSVIKVIELAREHVEVPWAFLAPALVTVAGVFQFIRFGVFFLPEVLDIGEKVKGLEKTPELFAQLLREAWRVPQVQATRLSALLILVAGFALLYLINRFVTRTYRAGTYYSTFTVALLLLGAALVLGWFTLGEIHRAYTEAIEAGEELEIWAEVVTISAGFALLLVSWKLWSTAKDRVTTAGTVFRVLAAIFLMVGGWALIDALPRAIQSGYKDWWQGLQTTVYYSLFTVPVQLSLALFLATLLFQEIKGKAFFRLIYFLPYITNPVAAASIFRALFSGNPVSPVNNLLSGLGLETMMWLDEPQGIFQLIAGGGVDIPRWLAGPSLALIVIVIYNIWTYAGYNTVVFLAGLGSIPSELYEAASIDGAGRFAQFRHVTIPLLSPTIYFLTLIAVIGTFKAFTHVWVLRSGAALGTTDTASIVIFNEFNRNSRFGYASALALVLMGLVLILTYINNRIAEEKVFYG